MTVQKINNSVYCNSKTAALNSFESGKNMPVPTTQTLKNFRAANYDNYTAHDSVSFKGSNITFSKRFWLMFRKLSNYMREPSEMTNAEIAAIGTGAIAPFAILCSPGKKADKEEDKKADREKKIFQAIRQPVSALLAFGFQVPTTVGIAAGLNKLAYERKIDLFKDKTIGDLIPNKKYLKKQAKKVLNGKASEKVMQEWAAEKALADNFDAIKPEFLEKIKQDYEEVGIKITPEELEKIASNKSKRNDFIAEYIANKHNDRLIDLKVEQFANKDMKITDLDLVTSDYQDLARNKYKEEFRSLKKEAKLSWFDNFIKIMGFSNDKLTKYEKAEKSLATKKGLEILKQDSPELFTPNGSKQRLKKYVENMSAGAQKYYNDKIFWITLVTNLFMVGISCLALNWLHPKFAEFLDGIKTAKAEQEASKNKEQEVKA